MPIEINPELFYSKAEIINLLKIGDSTFCTYKREGFPTHKVGQEVYTKGDEIIKFILSRRGGELYPRNIKKKK